MRTILAALVLLSACEPAHLELPGPLRSASITPLPGSPPASTPPASTPPVAAPSPPIPVAPAPSRPESTPPERRANGKGFTIALASGWIAQGVDDATLFQAAREPGGKLQVHRLAEREVLDSNVRCRAWGERTAKGIGGSVTSSSLDARHCSATATSAGFDVYLDAIERPTGSYVSICVRARSTDPVEDACRSMLASWREDASATPLQRAKRMSITFDNDHPVARGSGVSVRFPANWNVVEGAGDSLVQATTEDGGVAGLTATTGLSVIRRSDCEQFGPAFATMMKGHFVSAKIVSAAGVSTCRVDLEGALFAYVIIATSPDDKTYMFACGKTRGTVPEGDCKSIVDSWRFE